MTKQKWLGNTNFWLLWWCHRRSSKVWTLPHILPAVTLSVPVCFSTFDTDHLLILKSAIFWDIMPCSPLSGMPSNQLAEDFRLYTKQVGNGKTDLSSHWLTMGHDETAGISHDRRANQQEIRIWVLMAMKRGWFWWSRKTTGKKCKGVLGRRVAGMWWGMMEHR
jgi:hypothetical protein